MPQPRHRFSGEVVILIFVTLVILLFSNCAAEGRRVQVTDFRFLVNGIRLVEIEMFGTTWYCLPETIGLTPSVKKFDYIEIPVEHGCRKTITPFDRDASPAEKGS